MIASVMTGRDLPRYPVSRRDRAVDGAAVAEKVGGLAGEIQRVRDRFGEAAAGGDRAGRDVAVRAARERVGLPVVDPGVLHAGERRTNNPLQGREGDGCDLGMTFAGKGIRFGPRAPAGDDGGDDGQRGPPYRKDWLVGENEARGGCPARAIEAQGDAI